MRKSRLVMLLVLIATIFNAKVVFAGTAITSPIIKDGGTMTYTYETIGDATNDSIEILFTSATGATNVYPISIQGNYVGTLNSTITNLVVSSNIPPIGAFGGVTIGNDTFTTPPTVAPKLIISADEFTITHSINNAAIEVLGGGSLEVKGKLNIVASTTTKAALTGISAGNYADTMVFEKEVIINVNTPDYAFGFTVSTNVGDITFKENLHIKTITGSSGGSGLSIAGAMKSGSKVLVEGNLTVDVTGFRAHGVLVSTSAGSTKYGKLVVEKNVVINMHGETYSALSVQEGGYVEINGDLTIETESQGSSSTVYLIGKYQSSNYDLALKVKGDTSVIQTAGTLGYRSAIYGIGAINVEAIFGTSSANKTIVKTGGIFSHGMEFASSTVTFNSTVDVSTIGNGAVGINIISGNNYPNEIVFKAPVEVSTSGGAYYSYYPHGIDVKGVSNVRFEDTAKVSVSGGSTNAVNLTGTASPASKPTVIFEKTVNISTSGASSHGVALNGYAEVKVNGGGTIKTSGATSYALYYNGTSVTSSYKDIELSASSSNIAIASNGNFSHTIPFSGASIINGNVSNLSNNDSAIITLQLSDTSYWKGGAVQNASVRSRINLELSGSAYWNVTGNYRVDSVTMQSATSQIWFSESTATQFYTATIRSLSSTALGVLKLNVNMAGTGNGDKLRITTASGNYTLEIVNLTSTPAAEADELVVIELTNVPTSLAITLQNGTNKMFIQGMEYELVESANQLFWSLKKTGVIFALNPDVLYGLIEVAKAIDATISDELLLAKKSVWLVTNYKHQSFRDIGAYDDMKQNIFNLITGADIASFNNWNVGAFIGLTLGNQDVADKIVSTVDVFSLGFNAGYSNNGLNVSGYVRLANYLHSIEVSDLPELLVGRISVFGASASLQAMKNFYIADTGIFVAPKAKISFTHLFGFEHDFTVLTIKGSPISAFVSWVGLRAGLDYAIKDIPVSSYMEAGFIYDTNPQLTIFVDGNEEGTKLDAKRYEFGLGFDIYPSDSTSFTFEYKLLASKNLIEPIKIKISVTTSF